MTQTEFRALVLNKTAGNLENLNIEIIRIAIAFISNEFSSYHSFLVE